MEGFVEESLEIYLQQKVSYFKNKEPPHMPC